MNLTDENPCPKKAVVTGMGVVTPVGNDPEEFYKAVVQGQTAIKRLALFNEHEYPNPIGAPVAEPVAEIGGSSKLESWVVYCLHSALQQAGLSLAVLRSKRVVLVCGTFLGEVGLRSRGSVFPPPPFDKIARDLGIRLGLDLPSFTLTNACASGVQAVGLGADLIRLGRADLVIACGFEGLGEFVYTGMNLIRSLGTDLRPFDAGRDGTVLGEGAGVLILEEELEALDRGVKLWGEVLGWGLSNDAFHYLRPHQEARGMVKAMQMALKDGGLTGETLDYINAHGTGTRLNDSMETQAIKAACGKWAKDIPVSSIKGVIGHSLGASGILGTVATVLALDKSLLPPTSRFLHPDPECDLDYIPFQSRNRVIDTALCNGAGFGGVNGVLAIGRYRKAGCRGRVSHLFKEEIIAETACRWAAPCGDEIEMITRIKQQVDGLLQKRKLMSPLGDSFGIVFDAADGIFPAQQQFWDDLCHKGPRLASPAQFCFSFPGRIAGELAIGYGITGPCLTICDSEGTMKNGVELARILLNREKARQLMVCKLSKQSFVALIMQLSNVMLNEDVTDFYRIEHLLDYCQGLGGEVLP